MPSISRDGVAHAYDQIDGPASPWSSSTAGAATGHTSRRRSSISPGSAMRCWRSTSAATARATRPDGAYSMQVLADDVAWLCGELGVKRPVVIGHSMGGIVAFDLAVRYPELVAGVAMIDLAVFRPEASRAALPAFLERLKGPDSVAALQDYVGRFLILPTDDAERRARILAAMPLTPRHAMVGRAAGHVRLGPDRGRGQTASASPVHRQQRPGRSAISDASPRWCRA